MGVSEDFEDWERRRKMAQNGAKREKCFTKCFTMFHQEADLVKHLQDFFREIPIKTMNYD